MVSPKVLLGLAFVAQALAAATPPCTTTPIANPPANLYCNTQGTLTKPAPLGSPIKKSTSQACRDACLANKSCISFGFNTKTTACTQYSKTLIAQGIKKSTTSGVVFWNRNCFKTTCLTCNAPQTYCSGNACSNLQTDNANCGSCGNACGNGSTCKSGVCTDACNNSCGSSEVCNSGTCVCKSSTTLAGQPACGGSCNIDYTSSDQHCGSCANSCDTANGFSCVSGACQDSCSNSCGQDEVCSSGSCLCKPSTTLAGQPSCAGSCSINYNTDNQHCGGCDGPCDTTNGFTCQAGTCEDSCSNSCGQNEVCQNGNCLCAPSTTLAGQPSCDGSCAIDYTSSDEHCGGCDSPCDTANGFSCQSGVCTDSCNNSCGQNEVCQSGSCLCAANTTLAGSPNCGGSCNVNYQTSNANCGGCNSPCDTANGFSCQAGICKDSCNNSCGQNLVCQNGSCLCPSNTTLAGQPSCAGSCNVNYQTSNANCGSCNNACSGGTPVCKAGVCSAVQKFKLRLGSSSALAPGTSLYTPSYQWGYFNSTGTVGNYHIDPTTGFVIDDNENTTLVASLNFWDWGSNWVGLFTIDTSRVGITAGAPKCSLDDTANTISCSLTYRNTTYSNTGTKIRSGTVYHFLLGNGAADGLGTAAPVEFY